jgi:hypothetical protein
VLAFHLKFSTAVIFHMLLELVTLMLLVLFIEKVCKVILIPVSLVCVLPVEALFYFGVCAWYELELSTMN